VNPIEMANGIGTAIAYSEAVGGTQARGLAAMGEQLAAQGL